MKPPPHQQHQNVASDVPMATTIEEHTPLQGLTETLLPELRREVLQYLDAQDLAELSCVSKQLSKECEDDALPQYRTAVIRCPAPAKNNMSMAMGCYHSLHPLLGALLKIPTRQNQYASKFPVFEERFTRLQAQGICHLPKINAREAKPVANSLKLQQITHMDLSSDNNSNNNNNNSYPQVAPSIGRLMTQVVPNLQELDLSYNHVTTAVLADAARNCPKLERIHLQNGLAGGVASSTGIDWKNCHALKELLLDGTLLQASKREVTEMFQDADNVVACPLRYCMENLERVSLKGCRHYDRLPKNAVDVVSEPFTQLGLIKFVRNAPNLRWFRSDLTADNVKMLQQERPEVIFE
ncbi:expressed unknown protein [Seminavis robusta]|uniref:F-box domain-containing protein n=1 Tax=Seminavis robusta TaxID=568900 RepID=A0A9N8DU73_9STRA|nr:expressed unknown protein [Seminavis robusta]|eukprot:Sro278_g106650.1 n/a (353) ;mRNA; f:72811-73869